MRYWRRPRWIVHCRGAVQMGAQTVLIERSKMGGDCLNSGCVPSKALLAAGKAAKAAAGNPEMGIYNSAEPDIDFTAVKAHMADVIAGIAPHDSFERFTALGVRVIRAEARFESSHVILEDLLNRTNKSFCPVFRYCNRLTSLFTAHKWY